MWETTARLLMTSYGISDIVIHETAFPQWGFFDKVQREKGNLCWLPVIACFLPLQCNVICYGIFAGSADLCIFFFPRAIFPASWRRLQRSVKMTDWTSASEAWVDGKQEFNHMPTCHMCTLQRRIDMMLSTQYFEPSNQPQREKKVTLM